VNYYPHHIGDYLRDTLHLSLLEHGAYRRMLDYYYASEKPLPLETQWVCKLIRADSEEERKAVAWVLENFFEKGVDGWHNKRADDEVRASNNRAKVARRNGKKGGRPKTQQVISGLAKPNLADNPDESSQNQIQNQNQKPKKEKEQRQQRSRGSRLPSDWQPSEILKAFATSKRPDLDFLTTVERFKNHWAAAPGSKGVKLDWEATFRNWVLGERGGAPVVPDYAAHFKE
jgi:uncharacterized protein YdaU (DUF1376 family)